MEESSSRAAIDAATFYRRLRGSAGAAEMLALAAAEVCERAGFDRCVVVTVAHDELTTRGSAPIPHPESEALRRTLLAKPAPLVPGSLESELVRRPGTADGAGTATGPSRPSALAGHLGLHHVAVAPVTPEARPVALVLAERGAPAVSDDERLRLAALGHGIAAALEIIVVRRRAADLHDEVRQASLSMQALAREVSHAPISVPSESGHGPSSPRSVSTPGLDHALTTGGLSAREASIAALIAEGRSNREIAASLVLSPETVKSHVSSILRKVGATNRAEAVARLAGRPGTQA